MMLGCWGVGVVLGWVVMQWGGAGAVGDKVVAVCDPPPVPRLPRLWDIVEGKCKQVFKGHVDSVNACCWQPYTCHLCTASSDKTVSIWDARTGLCAQTFYGHQNSCSHAAFR